MNSYFYKDEFLGEFIGTFFLVLFGLGAICASTIFGSHSGLFQVALLWGVAVTIAVYVGRHLCNAHYNPAVSVAMVVSGRMDAKKLPTYLLSQFIGGFVGALMVYILFNPSIVAFEASNGIVRGSFESVTTAKMFGEFYVQPGATSQVSFGLAMFAEVFGTFMLVLTLFLLTDSANVARPNDQLGPLLVGLAVTSVICLIAPLTQACINPARDLGPRVVTMIFGWGKNAFPDSQGGFIWIYVLAPILGGVLAAVAFSKVIEPALNRRSKLQENELKDILDEKSSIEIAE
ncbi:MIP/aquaporin family protein [Peptostreptococcus russellii]|uniref:MIP/aquaporin family protein n=1 Tax=Peptostreptococcus russellii TaxID=215200 RepID=UPI003F586390